MADVHCYVPTLDREVTVTRAKGGRGRVVVTPGGGEPVAGRIRSRIIDGEDVVYEVSAPGLTIPLTVDEYDTLTRPKRRVCDQCGGPLRNHGLDPTILGDEAYCHDCT